MPNPKVTKVTLENAADRNKILAAKRCVERSDRFIASRSVVDFDLCHYALTDRKHVEESYAKYNSSSAASSLQRHSLSLIPLTKHAIASQKHRIENIAYRPRLRGYYEASKIPTEKPSSTKARPSTPATAYRILDAPSLLDDFYLNVLDWGKNDVIAVALANRVYLYHPNAAHVHELGVSTSNSRPTTDYVSSLAWVNEPHQNYLAVGTAQSGIQLWDTQKQEMISCHSTVRHNDRICALAWSGQLQPGSGPNLLASGSRDSAILLHDIRMPGTSGAMNTVAKLSGHKQEVCGLKWSSDGMALASGGNDNRLCLYDIRSSGTCKRKHKTFIEYRPRETINAHYAAVKAIAWCPWERHMLATGGGTADRFIHLWDTCGRRSISMPRHPLKSVETAAQVSSVKWSAYNHTLISSHGYGSDEIHSWSAPSLTHLGKVHHHSRRILHLACSPDGSEAVSAGADKQLRMYKLSSKKVSLGRVQERKAWPVIR